MAPRRAFPVISTLVLVCMAGLAVIANAAEDQSAGNGGLLPVIPMGQGDSCVKDTDFMRRNHMTLLKHQRDETMKEGIRGKPYSLKECISCHVVNGPDAKPVTVSSPEHFCRSCHDYAAVSIDCFQCHASRPESGDLPADHQMSSAFPTTATVNGTE